MTTHTASRGALLLATIAMTLAGCSKSAAPTTSATTARHVASTHPPSTATLRTSPAVRRLPWRDGQAGATTAAVSDKVDRTVVAGTAHKYRLWAPAAGRSPQPAPLVLLFHGFAADGETIANLTKLPARGMRRGFIVVAPDGPNQTWQFSGSGTDAAFVDRILSTVTATRCVDLDRVYVAGFSAGAAFAITYACGRPDRVAAMVTVAVDFTLGCTKPMAILAFHGTDDPLVPYRNGAVGLSLPGVHVRGTMLNMGDWARLGHCSSRGAGTHRSRGSCGAPSGRVAQRAKRCRSTRSSTEVTCGRVPRAARSRSTGRVSARLLRPAPSLGQMRIWVISVTESVRK